MKNRTIKNKKGGFKYGKPKNKSTYSKSKRNTKSKTNPKSKSIVYKPNRRTYSNNTKI